MQQNSVVDLNKLVKIRFSDGEELFISVFEKSPIQLNEEFTVNKDAPVGKALLSHSRGKQIEYRVRNNTYKVTILEVYR